MTDKEIIRHKICKFQKYFNDGEGFYDGWWCNNPECKCDSKTQYCPHFPSETYNCEYYVEGVEYEY